MICKERDAEEHLARDMYAKAGERAEDTMAHYLRRAFRDDPEVWVFNDLRFKSDDDDACQIDHLVMHRSGFIVIESKSVTSKVRILPNGEWERVWNNHWQGMPSPIKQAERQVDFLRAAFQAYHEELLGKTLLGLVQMTFKNMPFDVLVAISDAGSIDRKGTFPEVNKAEFIKERIQEIVQRHKKARGFLSRDTENGLYNLKDNEIAAIGKWLLDHHYPRSLQEQRRAQKEPARAAPPPPPPPPPVQSPVPPPAAPVPPSSQAPGAQAGRCEACGGESAILYGQYGYYWKCSGCGKNMPIKEFCPHCREKIKLRKDRQRFYKSCVRCGTPEELFFEGK